MNSKNQNQVKREIKNINAYTNYKKAFLVKKMFFILTKVNEIFDSKIAIKDITDSEIAIGDNIDDIEVWANEFEKCGKFFKEPFNNCDWYSFGKFIFYYWNQQKYFKHKFRKKSIYSQENFNQINNLKTAEYNKWISSMLKSNDINFNIYIRKVLKLL